MSISWHVPLLTKQGLIELVLLWCNKSNYLKTSCTNISKCYMYYIAVPQMRWHIPVPSKRVKLTLAWHLLLCKFHKASPHWQTQNHNLYSVSTLQGVPNLLLMMWIHDDYHGHKTVLKIERIMIADFKNTLYFIPNVSEM